MWCQEYIKKFLTVWIKPGEEIGERRHLELLIVGMNPVSVFQTHTPAESQLNRTVSSFKTEQATSIMRRHWRQTSLFVWFGIRKENWDTTNESCFRPRFYVVCVMNHAPDEILIARPIGQQFSELPLCHGNPRANEINIFVYHAIIILIIIKA